ncbi:MAG TPA: hypothetical protein VHQ22_21375 [Terriglobales bacterium]|jgi:hypothetical protein|nr:hypothetical protein [Terriglobales bacterium]
MAANPHEMRMSWEQLRAIPEVSEALKKIDQDNYRNNLNQCYEGLATYYNFESYRHSIQSLKAQSALHSITEQMYARRLAETIDAYQSFIAAARNIAQMYSASGLDRVISNHSQDIFWELPNNPRGADILAKLRLIGVSDTDLSNYFATLKANGWNPLQMEGNDGTFMGAVNAASEHLKTLQGMQAALKQHGIPVIEGDLFFLIAFLVIVVAGTVCTWAGWCTFGIG